MKYVSKKGLVFRLLLMAILVGIVPGRLCAEAIAPTLSDVPPQLRYNLKLDLAATIAASTGWVVMQALESDIAPSACRWCGVNGFDGWGHDNFKWSDRNAADTTSSVLAYGVAPLVSLGLDALAAYKNGGIRDLGIDLLVISESVAASALFNEILKIAVGRERPDVHYGEVASGSTANTSFYSGHTNLAFSLAATSGTVATMRGYELAPWIWGAGLAVATTTGYLRIAADKHYITDVIGGAVIGSAFGFCLPYFLHRPESSILHGMMLSPSPAKGGMTLNLTGAL